MVKSATCSLEEAKLIIADLLEEGLIDRDIQNYLGMTHRRCAPLIRTVRREYLQSAQARKLLGQRSKRKQRA